MAQVNGQIVTAPIPLAQQLRQAYAEEDIQLIRRTIAKGANEDELALFIKQCIRTGLDPFSRQIYAIRRKQYNSQSRSYEEAQVIQVSIDGFRLIADRTGQYAGQDGPWWCGPDGDWRDVWLKDEPPAAAKVTVYRHDHSHPISRIALYKSYVQTNAQDQPISRWKTDPAGMLAKCAEALALRAAFPNDLSGLYTADELQNNDKADSVEGSFTETRALPTSTAAGDALAAEVSAILNSPTTAVELPPLEVDKPAPREDPDFIMTLEEALAETDSGGKKYSDMEPGLLEKRLQNVRANANRRGIAEDLRMTLKRKELAILKIQEHRKQQAQPPALFETPAQDPLSVLDKRAETDPKSAYWQLTNQLGWSQVQAQEQLEIERGNFAQAYKVVRAKAQAETGQKR